MPLHQDDLNESKKVWLVTGGSGFIGGHVISFLQSANIPWIILDIDLISAQEKFSKNLRIEYCDIRVKKSLRKVFENFEIEGVIHLAALKSVEDSQTMKDKYYETNVLGTKNILEIMEEFDIQKMIFSSSAAVYGSDQSNSQVKENAQLGPVSYYGQTKVDAEELISQSVSQGKINAIIFRYFNVAGSLNKKLRDTSIQNLIPITIQRIQLGVQPEIFGDTYNTPDGTPIRDYVDVRDIARAHVNAIQNFWPNSEPLILNLGTGKGASVREVIDLTKSIMKSEIEVLVKGPRSGDIGEIVANCDKANEKIGFKANFDLRSMIETSLP